MKREPGQRTRKHLRDVAHVPLFQNAVIEARSSYMRTEDNVLMKRAPLGFVVGGITFVNKDIGYVRVHADIQLVARETVQVGLGSAAYAG
jgi:hypothetical protein